MNLDAPILYAVMGRNETLALARIRNGNDLDYSEEERGTALHMAARLGLLATVRALLDAGANPNPRVEWLDQELTPLDCAKSRIIRNILKANGGVSAGQTGQPRYPQYNIHDELKSTSLIDGLAERLRLEENLAPEEEVVRDVATAYAVFQRPDENGHEVANALLAGDAFEKVGATTGRAALKAIASAMGADAEGYVDANHAEDAIYEPTQQLLDLMSDFAKTRPDTEERLRRFVEEHVEVFEA